MNEQQEVVLRITGQNSLDHPRLKPCLVYGELYDSADKHLMISATVEYILAAVAQRQLKLVRVELDPNIGFEVKQK